jgi:hypothetical protein
MGDYNGYKNFETWKLALHLNNDGSVGFNSLTVPELAQELQDVLYSMASEIPGNYFHDVVTTELSQIDFEEVAKNLLNIS